MGNLIKFLRHEISSIPPELSESDAKSKLLETLTSFNEEKIVYARKSIVSYHSELINSDDTILTYGYSTAVIQVTSLPSLIKMSYDLPVDTVGGCFNYAVHSDYCR